MMVKLIRVILHIARIELPRFDASTSTAVKCFESLHVHPSKAFAARFENNL
jgi:hypothetical protein